MLCPSRCSGSAAEEANARTSGQRRPRSSISAEAEDACRPPSPSPGVLVVLPGGSRCRRKIKDTRRVPSIAAGRQLAHRTGAGEAEAGQINAAAGRSAVTCPVDSRAAEVAWISPRLGIDCFVLCGEVIFFLTDGGDERRPWRRTGGGLATWKLGTGERKAGDLRNHGTG